LLNYFFPPLGLGEEAPFVDDVVHGVPSPKLESEQNGSEHANAGPEEGGEKVLAKETVNV
jgi:hypothetical protein